ncbi:putative meiosis arrest female protein [Medicago truncatula]|uniref:Putative meiosis arrest female protein n=1 Tax=Medicago truncatula TaxID=3880 RepID=A0A396JET0_MEDTR|nr:putative meiosis arrest female protein [Medicago truncatula]
MFPLFLKNLSFLPSCLSRKVFTRFQVCGFSSSSSSFPVVSVWWHLDILCLHRNGIFMGDLRAELTKCDLPLVKRFYGHKKFSNFLVSIPHVQLEYLGEGDFWVCLVPLTTSVVKNKQNDGAITQKLHNIMRVKIWIEVQILNPEK